MIFIDCEVFKYDFVLCWLDTKTRKYHHIVNNKEKIEQFYDYYKNEIMVGYNIRGYDQWILKSILCDFNPFDMNKHIITDGKKGFEFSKLLNKFPVIIYDCSVGFRSLKELEAFGGKSIVECSVPWDIQRPLTQEEMTEVVKYCKYDVEQCFEVFVETKEEFESHIGLIKEFDLPLECLGKTKAQISAIILGATKRPHNDEFDITLPDTIEMGRYEWASEHFIDWARTSKSYEELTLKATINDVPHTFGIGGLHGSIDNYYGEGTYIMADVASYYPALMIEYAFLSRNVVNPHKYKQIRDERLIMKANKDPRQAPRKIVLNSTFGGCKDQYNNLYDPVQSNNVCIAGQLLLTDLLDKLYGKCELIQTNTDGILVKLFKDFDKDEIISICNEWMKRTRMDMEFDVYKKIIQKDVNNYIIIDDKGHVKRRGSYVKKLSLLDNDLPIVNKAIVDYFVNGVPVEKTISNSDSLIDFQKITKVSGKYEYASHNGIILHERVHRCFASKDFKDGTLYKKHNNKTTLDKTAGTPINCFIDNSDIRDKKIPTKLDTQWYINLANERIKEFLGKH